MPVLDRVGLIIEIFGQRARTREARLQVMIILVTPPVHVHLLPVENYQVDRH